MAHPLRPGPKFKSKETNMPHIGKLIRTYIKKHHIAKSAIARKMDRNRATVERLVKRPSIQLAILWEISEILQYNFIADVAAQLPNTYGNNVPDHTLPLQEELQTLKEENKILKAQLDAFKEVLRKS
ncbi:MAG TPA: hypothetical protein DCS66_25245 [Flavobacteriaceae bacterium]|nr:hypothetical protein [Flavobacteriaceae bacterium]HAT67866.1 hypothetical protein [Flavobacteriaceae bacterium]|tara:strand:- start:276 stop:656 length:381 start_codon:yes stop_codon:yes gene_type:complete